MIFLLAGATGMRAQGGAGGGRPANRVAERVRPWVQKFSHEDYDPQDELEKSLYDYFKRLGTEIARGSIGDVMDFSRISGRARRELAPETERMIGLFVAEGYTRGEAEQYFQALFDRMQQDMTVYFSRANESSRPRVKPVDASTSDSQMEKAVNLLRSKDNVGALQALDNVLRFAPANVRAVVETAIRQQAVGQLAEARENFDLARGLYPRLPVLYGLRGEVRAYVQDYYGAINDFSVALVLQPNNILAYSSRGRVRLALGDYEGAIDDFGLHIASGYRQLLEYVYLDRSTAYYRQGNLALALDDVESAVRVAPKYAAAYRSLALIQRRQGKYDLALKSLDRFMELNPGDISVLSLRTWAYYDSGQPELALADARRLADEDADLGITLAVLLDALEQYNQAETQYRRIIARAEQADNNRRWCYANFQLDMMLRRLGRFERDYLKDVLDWPDGWPKRIGLYLAGRIDGASLLKAAQQEVNREKRRNQVCEANYYLGVALWTGGKEAEAIPYLETTALPEYMGNFECTLAQKDLRVIQQRKLRNQSRTAP